MIARQLISELKSQPVITWVSVTGTAFAMFLIMLVVMLNQVNVAPIAPESNRNRLLYVSAMRASSTDPDSHYMSSSSLGMSVVNRVFGNLTTPERVSVFTKWNEEKDVSVPGVTGFTADTKATDDDYFRIYNFGFLAGSPYDSADVSSHLRKAVITETIARTLFSSAENAIGKDMYINDIAYNVCGVVKDVSTVTAKAYSQIWTPLAEQTYNEWSEKWGVGQYTVAMLAHKGQPLTEITDEVNDNLSKYNAYKAADGIETDFNGGPYTEEGDRAQGGSNVPADLPKEHRNKIIVYTVLLLIPAINLSSMTRSRLACRTCEIGVRRAFGATRLSIILSVLMENMLITLAGGLAGLAMACVFGSLMFDTIYSAGSFASYNTVVSLGTDTLLSWSTFAYALLFCFILNLLSTGVPAWRASRTNPVEALAAKTR